ncbi:hypothetical protein I6E11_04075 [Bacteroides caecigallinarum]|uniref:hypothetical protein n=1 Tax=Bacteroides caecigallinarum TaxID=1411144 RepID=UPI001F3B8D3A|nr:hypothetical protein [Bacteroides caecigallinarum]MCF2592988.1 hypothetical protein [Bacteroides caecigallinarum]
MKARILLLWIMAFCCSVALFSQTLSDESRISLNAVVADEDITAEACKNLENKLTRAIAANGYADNGYSDRFVLTAKVDILSKDVVPSTPARISQKLDVTFMVGDIIENKVYSTCTVSLAGIGTNETKAFISAFSKVNPNHKELQAMLVEARHKIVTFYTDHCDEIVRNAQTLADMQKYDEAIFRLMSVPNVCAECFQKCQSVASAIYSRKIDSEAVALLNQAKTEWMSHPNADGVQAVASIIGQISHQAKNYDEVVAFRQEVSSKLEADAKKEWDFQMKQYEDNQAFKRSIVDACKAIGVAFGNGQPKNVTRNIVSRW